MTSLQERAYELVENIIPICPQSHPGLFWDKFIITIKSSEVIAWAFDCLICEQVNCPLFLRENLISFTKEKIRDCA